MQNSLLELHIQLLTILHITTQGVFFAGDVGTLSPGNLERVTGNFMDNPRIIIKMHLI
jgi:hypothetical protein